VKTRIELEIFLQHKTRKELMFYGSRVRADQIQRTQIQLFNTVNWDQGSRQNNVAYWDTRKTDYQIKGDLDSES
jgi:hypothetical protein